MPESVIEDIEDTLGGLVEVCIGLLEFNKELEGLMRGELEGRRGLVDVRFDLFIHFSMCPFSTSRRLNFLPQS